MNSQPTNDFRIEVVKDLIVSGKIVNLTSLCWILPKSVLAARLGTNNNRMTRLLSNPKEFSLQEIDRIAEILKIEPETVQQLLDNQATGRNVVLKTAAKNRRHPFV